MKILVLAGGSDQIALIRELKSRGHYTVLIDYYDNPPAKFHADKHIVASTLDIARVKKIAIEENVDIVCTACTDQALLTVANVSEQLGLPCYISSQTALKVTNKSYMKKVLTANNISTSKFVILNKVALTALKNFQFPLIVKPVDCNSSKGVKRIDNIEDASKYLQNAIRLSRTKTAIIEELKIGKEISADFYIVNSEAKYLSATSSLKIAGSKSFTILCSDYPAVNDTQIEKLINIANKIASAFELNNCPLLVQLIINGNDISVIECSARIGGGSKYKLIQVLSGVDIMSKYVDLILGSNPTVAPLKQVNYCRMVYVYSYLGIFDHVEGLETLKQEKIVDDYYIYKTKGMKIICAETSSDRIAGYLIKADTKEALVNKLRYVDSHIRVISEKGADIMIHNLLN